MPRSAAVRWALAALPFALLAVWRMGDGTGLDADDHAQYLMHAAAIAEGRPYSDIKYIYNPAAPFIGPRAQPPGLPLTVGAVFAAVGQNLLVVRLVMLAFGIGFVVSAGRALALTSEDRLGLGVTALCGLSPPVLHATTQVLTDVPFAALVWSVIWLADRPGAWNARRILWIAGLGLLAVAYRPAGVVLGPALLLFAAVRFREHGWRPAVPAGIWVAAALVVLAVLPIASGGLASAIDLTNPFRHVTSNWNPYRFSVLESHLYPFPWNTANDAYHLLSVLLMIVGLVVWVRTAFRSFAVHFTLVYAGMFLVLPAEIRYFWPLFPVFVFGLLHGLRVVVGYIWRGQPERAASVALLVGGLVGLFAGVRAAAAPRPQSLHDLPGARDLFEYVTSLDDTVRIAFAKPRVLAWETGRAVMGPSRRSDRVMGQLRAACITHLVTSTSDLDRGRDRALRAVVANEPSVFAREFEAGGFLVFRYLESDCVGDERDRERGGTGGG